MLRVFGNRVLREIFGPAWDEVMGERERRRNETLYFMVCTHQIFG